MLLKDVNQLLLTRYDEVETGYFRLPDGQWYVAILSQMPRCKAKLVEWWFRNYVEQLIKKPSELKLLNKYKSQKIEHAVGTSTSPLGRHLVKNKLSRFGFRFDDPDKLLNTSITVDAGIDSIICGESFLPSGIPEAYIVHLIRDNYYGCEIRTRVWIYNGNEKIALDWMKRYIDDFVNLSDFLRMLFEEKLRLNNNPIVVCKFCHSYHVVKNGLRKNIQYWLCKSCGRGFVGNSSLPKMRYPETIVTKAIFDYLSGKSIKIICREIEKEFSILPSHATVYRWIKISQIA